MCPRRSASALKPLKISFNECHETCTLAAVTRMGTAAILSVTSTLRDEIGISGRCGEQTLSGFRLLERMGPVKVDIKVKISGFCGQLGDDALEQLAREEGQFAVYARARAALESGSVDQALEADLDALNACGCRKSRFRVGDLQRR